MERRKCAPDCACKRHTSGAAARRKPKVALLCEFCDAKFFVSPSRENKARFCSTKCFKADTAQRMAQRRSTGKTYFHDMSIAEFKQRMANQDGLCGICAKSISGKEAQRDHCHLTGEWRGLLCGKCNRALGLFDDDPARLLRAADYLVNGGVADEYRVARQ